MKTKLLKLVNQAFLRIESWENENKIEGVSLHIRGGG